MDCPSYAIPVYLSKFLVKIHRLSAAVVLVYIIREDNTVVDSCCLKKKNEINGALTISRSRIVF